MFADLYGEQAIPPQTIESLDIPIGFSGGRILWSEGSEVIKMKIAIVISN